MKRSKYSTGTKTIERAQNNSEIFENISLYGLNQSN